MPVTQKDIAARVGVERSLVAHALRGNPRIAEATRLRIMEVATEMGYNAQSNLEARSLIARRHGRRVESGVIAVLLGDPLEGKPLQNMPFFGEIFRGIQDEVARRGKEVSYHFLRVGQLPQSVLSGQVDGVICVYSRTISNDLRNSGVLRPTVRLDGYVPGEWNIHPDNEPGIHALTQHLIQLGHERIAFLGGPPELSQNQIWAQQRLRGFERAMAEAGLPILPELMRAELKAYDEEAGYEAMSHFLASGVSFTAMVCCNDAAAIGAMAAAESAGLRVPRDISLTGFDGLNQSKFANQPALTTAAFDRHQMGCTAISLLEELLSMPEKLPHDEVLPVQLLMRDTCAAPAPDFV